MEIKAKKTQSWRDELDNEETLGLREIAGVTSPRYTLREMQFLIWLSFRRLATEAKFQGALYHEELWNDWASLVSEPFFTMPLAWIQTVHARFERRGLLRTCEMRLKKRLQPSIPRNRK